MSATTHMAGRLCCLVLLTGCETVSAPVADSCIPAGYDKAALLELKANEFRIDDAAQRQAFAMDLLDCLGNHDPVIRDGVAYEAYASLLRNKQLDGGTIEQLRIALLEILRPDSADDSGFQKPFAALILAEVVRSDRIDRIFNPQQRAEIVSVATAYLEGVNDYRGFDEQEGWRHGVAHAADLHLQLALNPAVTWAQLMDLANAIASQVAPAGAHFYIYGEPARLARPIYYLAGRGKLNETQWADWFANLASPAPLASWEDAWKSQTGLAKRHNTRMFAESLYVYATAYPGEHTQVLADGALSLLNALN